jgi:hypothetical protein
MKTSIQTKPNKLNAIQWKWENFKDVCEILQHANSFRFHLSTFYIQTYEKGENVIVELEHKDILVFFKAEGKHFFQVYSPSVFKEIFINPGIFDLPVDEGE